MEKIKTVYLAGKITGDPNFKEKFDAAARELEKSGFVVCNPAVLPPTGFTYDAYIRMSAAMLAECEAICLLSDWEDSAGAISEYVMSERCKKEILYFDEWFAEVSS